MIMIMAVAVCMTLALPGCKKAEQNVSGENPALLRISPTLTRATDTSFEEGDRIGVTVSKSGETYAENAMMEFSQSVFSGDLEWYEDTETTSEIYAYYPYSESGVPATFTVAADQSKGTSPSDFIIGSIKDAKPSEDAIAMTFRHVLNKVVVEITNDTDANITSVILKGSKTTADVNVNAASVTVSASSETADITAYEAVANERYYAILVPQTVSMVLEINTSDSKTYSQDLEEITLGQGGERTVTARISEEQGLQVKVAGEIEDWTDEGEIGPGEGNEPAIELTILKQWVADLSEAQDGSTRKCFDLSTEGSILVGDWTPGMEAYMEMFGITEYDPATSFFAMVSGPEQIVSITPADETSGTVTYSSDTDMDGIGDTEFSLTYSNLTETTVDITMADVYSGEEATYNCRAADEPVKVYTYADASM